MAVPKEIKNKVPYGYGAKIAEKAGVSKTFVSKWLNNTNVKSEKVELATLEILAELSRKKQSLIEQIL